jgi:chromosome segregation ATPase
MTRESAQERQEFLEKITLLESHLETQKEELNQQTTLLTTLQSNLIEMTTARDVLARERDEQIEKLATYQELASEREATSTQRWTEQIKSLQMSLAETEESLLVSQSTIKTYVRPPSLSSPPSLPSFALLCFALRTPSYLCGCVSRKSKK